MRKQYVRDRRSILVIASCGAAATFARPSRANDNKSFFIAEAFRMRDRAVASGDQPYGAVVVKDGTIIGYGPSRVIVDRNADAHAERVALWDAQQRLGSKIIAGAVIYATSQPCAACQAALAQARISRMVYGSAGTEGRIPGP